MVFSSVSDIRVAKKFDSIFLNLKENYGCSYLFYLKEVSGVKTSYSSNREWYDIYVGQGMINQCPLLRVTQEKLKRQNGILLWDHVKPVSPEERTIVGIKEELDICNGITFGIEVNGKQEYLGLASEKYNVDFPRAILEDNIFIRLQLEKLRLLEK